MIYRHPASVYGASSLQQLALVEGHLRQSSRWDPRDHETGLQLVRVAFIDNVDRASTLVVLQHSFGFPYQFCMGKESIRFVTEVSFVLPGDITRDEWCTTLTVGTATGQRTIPNSVKDDRVRSIRMVNMIVRIFHVYGRH